MRCFAPIPSLALCLTLGACTEPVEPADPGEVLVDFADLMADDVYRALWGGIEEEDGIELWVPESGASLAGSVGLPTTSGASYGVDGELSADWSLLFTVSDGPMEGEYTWDWDFDMDIGRLVLPSSEVSGAGAWAVDSVYYDNVNDSHVFEGSLAIDGGEAMDLSYEAHFSGNLHWVRGTIGDVEVDWENPNPDLP
jgi:hypothetical protein